MIMFRRFLPFMRKSKRGDTPMYNEIEEAINA